MKYVISNQLQDDGSHSIACERCNVWQHSACNGIKQQDAEREDFHFLCGDCKRRAADANKPKISLKLRGFGSSASPKDNAIKLAAPSATSPSLRPSDSSRILDRVEISVPQATPTLTPNTSFTLMNGPSLSPQGQSQGPPGIHIVPNAYNSPSNFTGSSAPVMSRPLSSGLTAHRPSMNGVAQSPPQVHWGYGNVYVNGTTHSQPQSNGQVGADAIRPHTPNTISPYNPYSNAFERQRPGSAHSNGGMSPPKLPTSLSPPRTNEHMNTPANPLVATPTNSFTTPNIGNSLQSTPQQGFMSAHQQHPAHVLPGASSGFSPAKHSPPRPTSGQTVAAPVLPPVAALSPSSRPPIMDPPVKNPTPERPRENGHLGPV